MGLIVLVIAFAAAGLGLGLTVAMGVLALFSVRRLVRRFRSAAARACIWIAASLMPMMIYALLLRSLPYDRLAGGGSPEKFFDAIVRIAFLVPAGPGIGAVIVALVAWLLERGIWAASPVN